MNELVLDKEQAALLAKIKTESGIPDDRFVKGTTFAYLVAAGKTRVDAYMEAFGESREKARSNASNVFRSSWIQKLIKLFEINEDLVFLPLKNLALKKAEEILNKSDDEKIVLDAAKTILKYVTDVKKIEKQTAQVEEEKDNANGILEELNKRIRELSQEGNIVTKKETIEMKKVIL